MPGRPSRSRTSLTAVDTSLSSTPVVHSSLRRSSKDGGAPVTDSATTTTTTTHTTSTNHSYPQMSTASPQLARSSSLRKFKGKSREDTTLARTEPPRRVLPARIRRAAGGGAEGIREVEEMVVDWLERWGEIVTTPPDHLVLHLSTLPVGLIDPPTFKVASSTAATVPVTPGRARSGGLTLALSPVTLTTPAASAVFQSPHLDTSRIETPSWIMVRQGEDDVEEARDEVAHGVGPGPSPNKRLRRGIVGVESSEDTSDAYYAHLHRKFEVFERRQRVREREKLQFERYKMRARIDLLRNMSTSAWSSIVSAILSRADPATENWSRGKRKLEVEGIDWLRRRLIREGVEVLRRYDQLLPSESKESKESKRQKRLGETHSTPSAASSLSPPPTAHPVSHPAPTGVSPIVTRIHALREHSLAASAHGSGPGAAPSPAQKRLSVPPPAPTTRAPHGPLRQTRLEFPRKTQSQTQSPLTMKIEPGEAPHNHIHPVARVPTAIKTSDTPLSSPATRAGRRSSAFVPPTTSSGTPCLVEAAQRREDAVSEASEARFKVEEAERDKLDGRARAGRYLPREKTRLSERISLVSPFGMPLPSAVESKSEFSLSDEEDFWPIIAARESHATDLRRHNSSSASSETPGVRPIASIVTDDEVRDMEGVEAAVVL